MFATQETRTSWVVSQQSRCALQRCAGRCVRRDDFSRNLFEEVSARSGTRTREVTSYNASYGVLPCFWTFCTFLFRMHLNPGKRPAGPPKSGGNPEIVVVDVSLAGRFLASTSLVATMSAPFGLRLSQETAMDDPLENVQPYPVELRPERRGEGNSPLSRRGGQLGG